MLNLTSGRVALVTALAMAALALCFAGTANAGSRTFTLGITPSSAPAGASTNFTATFRNTSDDYDLGSANLTVPPGFTLISASLVGAGPGTATVAGNTVQLRNLDIDDDGGSRSVAVRAGTSCTSSSGTWGVIARKYGDFRNKSEFTLTGAAPTTAVLGQCSLAFVQSPPASIGAGVAFPVEVEVRDATGQRSTASAAPITLSLVSAGAAGTLGGTASKAPIAGLASYSVSVSAPDFSVHRLRAQSGVGEVTSDEMTVHSASTVCAEDQHPCSITSTMNSTTFSMNSKSELGAGNDATTLTIDWNDGLKPDCGYILGGLEWLAYNEVSPDFAVFDAGARAVEATLTLGADLLAAGGIEAANELEFCYSGPKPFTAKATPDPIELGSPAIQTGEDYDGDGINDFKGLLRDCAANGSVPPCVVSRQINEAGDGVVAVDLPEGDPKGIG